MGQRRRKAAARPYGIQHPEPGFLIGAIFCGPQGILGCKLLGSPRLFAKAFPKIFESFAYNVIFTEERAQTRCKEAEGRQGAVLTTPVSGCASAGEGTHVRLETEKIIGSPVPGR